MKIQLFQILFFIPSLRAGPAERLLKKLLGEYNNNVRLSKRQLLLKSKLYKKYLFYRKSQIFSEIKFYVEKG